MAKEGIIEVPVKEFEELMKLIAEQNKLHENTHQTIIDEIRRSDLNHQQRYQELFRLLNKRLKSHEKRIADLEERVTKLEKNKS